MRVLLSGYYGFGNLGDEALLATIAGGLAARGFEPVALSGDPADTRRRHDLPAAARGRGLLPALLRADALVSGGGGLLQNGTSHASLRYYLGVVRLARRLGKRVVVYGQSVGPLDARGERAVARALRGVPVAVRDRASQTLLARLGVEAQLCADPALLLDASARVLPPPPGAPLLLVPRAGHPELNAALAELARRLHRAGIPLAATVLHHAEDAPALDALAAALPDGALRCAHPESVGEALERVAASRYVVSVRLHPLVFATALGRGHAGLVYDPKVTGFLAESGGAAFSAPVAVDVLEATARSAVPVDGTRRARLLERAAGGLDWLAATLRGEPSTALTAAAEVPR